MSRNAKILTVLALIGVIISAYLTIKSNDPTSVACSIGGACETVLSSRYAHMLGLPTSAWGLGWYLVTVGLIWQVFSRKAWPYRLFLAWSAIGLIFSLYLLSLEAFVIHAYCTWCLASLLVVILIFIFTLASRKEFVVDV